MYIRLHIIWECMFVYENKNFLVKRCAEVDRKQKIIKGKKENLLLSNNLLAPQKFLQGIFLKSGVSTCFFFN